MEKERIQTLLEDEFPTLLREIPDKPEKLSLRGVLPSREHTFLAVVGSRKYTSYGKETCEMLISALRGTNTVIVSGLALGIDSIAHRSALKAHLPTVAIPGSGLADEALYPRTNYGLAQDILNAGGGLLSEFEPNEHARPEYFPRRNRIMAGMSHATLVIEAGERSGTLITARLAMEYNRDVGVVPADITRTTSQGSNALIKTGAYPITCPDDLFEFLHIEKRAKNAEQIAKDLSPEEAKVCELLTLPLEKEELLESLPYETSDLNILLSEMEIKGLIKESMGKFRRNF